ncbi:MAG: CBS domain-containing protein [Steroidobacteraceae bacterium]
MLVENLMTRQVQSCQVGDSLAHAAQLMWQHDCGAIPVCAGNGAQRVVGVITDRDICMSALFEGKPLKDLRVNEAMSKSVTSVRPSDSLAQAERVMRDSHIRRLPVIDHDGALIGMISLADLAREAIRERSHPRKEVTENDIGNTLAAICEPPRHPLAA